MAHTLLQFDFPFPGPWGGEMATAMQGLATDIATEPGLVWKVWTETAEEGGAGGIYLFDSAEAAAAYKEKHTARLAEFGITDVRALSLDVNPALSRITRAPL